MFFLVDPVQDPSPIAGGQKEPTTDIELDIYLCTLMVWFGWKTLGITFSLARVHHDYWQ
jgi:hypothetical protein